MLAPYAEGFRKFQMIKEGECLRLLFEQCPVADSRLCDDDDHAVRQSWQAMKRLPVWL